ncbi:hypothetical protein ASPNIDRAFT_43922 [Aspergillus niger ATCC 1015]|uniref:P-loop containing nucleoside triphosphate hydrolase protein n=2 Tax=Aspergillus niger TaxID=5061 RepID=G3XU34_ASPNA|nr:hypothetical protein ASPNIDRAFT_43922 [Aspergillus niger ATCC 1015]KAI3011353.1 hypothetical protein CBS147345_6278 [Aspergillus niger]TPR05475.1 Ser-Thr-rich glycosyl-phosphatidyl-inositol-anchored membrane family protein [Aspergillus niger]SPB46618.1 unnamed protein product [Aspergillus niger]
MKTLRGAIYGFPRPPPRIRTKPLQVICVGLPRSGTESLSRALTQLGFKTYHGWDIVFDEPPYAQGWAQLSERKYSGTQGAGTAPISRAEFDALLGHCDAVVDTAAAMFSVEMIQAYPEAKVILNTRQDVDAWHRSAMKTLVAEGEDQWMVWFLHIFTADMYWLWRLYYTFGYPGMFRGRTTKEGLTKHGKRVYQEHGLMIRGSVPEERLLEWDVEDGWGPLCEFLGKDIPDEPFPNTNNPAAFRKHIEDLVHPRAKRSLYNFACCATSAGVLVTAIVLGVKKRQLWQMLISEIPVVMGQCLESLSRSK